MNRYKFVDELVKHLIDQSHKFSDVMLTGYLEAIDDLKHYQNLICEKCDKVDCTCKEDAMERERERLQDKEMEERFNREFDPDFYA